MDSARASGGTGASTSRATSSCLAHTLACITILSTCIFLAVFVTSSVLIYEQDEWGPWAYTGCAIVYAYAAAVCLGQWLVRFVRVSPRSSRNDLQQRRTVGCDRVTLVPFLFTIGFATRAIVFAGRASAGMGRQYGGGCSPGDVLNSASSRNFFRDGPHNPCSERYVPPSAASSSSSSLNRSGSGAHAGESTVLSRLGNMALFTAFSLVAWFLESTVKVGRAASATAAADSATSTAAGSDSADDAGTAATAADAAGDVTVLMRREEEDVRSARFTMRNFCNCGASAANTITVIANCYMWLFEILVAGVRLWVGRISGDADDQKFKCILGKIGNVENICIAVLFIVLIVAFLSSAYRLLHLHSLNTARRAMRDTGAIIIITRLKMKVKIIACVGAVFFLIKACAFLFSPITGLGFGGKACSVIYPALFYPVPEVIPGLVVVVLMSPDMLCRSGVAAWARAVLYAITCGRECGSCTAGAEDEAMARVREADDCARGLRELKELWRMRLFGGTTTRGGDEGGYGEGDGTEIEMVSPNRAAAGWDRGRGRSGSSSTSIATQSGSFDESDDTNAVHPWMAV